MIDTLGFIGTGIMGAPMVWRLLGAGLKVIVYNRTTAKSQALVSGGAMIAISAQELARQCDTIILMLSNDDAVREVVSDFKSDLKPGSTIIDCSTLSPSASVAMADMLAEVNVRYIDAPVTGSRPQAEVGELAFLIGASESSVQRFVPLFQAMGKRMFFLGDVGRGTTAKAINNMVVAVNLAVFAEALSLASACGLREEDFLDIVRQSGAHSAMIEHKGPRIVSRNFEPHFALKLMHKDAALVQKLASEHRQWTPLLDAVEQVYRKAAAEVDGGRQDVGSVYLMYLQGQGR